MRLLEARLVCMEMVGDSRDMSGTLKESASALGVAFLPQAAVPLNPMSFSGYSHHDGIWPLGVFVALTVPPHHIHVAP